MPAEEAGHARPCRIQSLLGRSSWSADAVRDYAVEALGDPGGVLVVDETGFLEKDEHSVGMARSRHGWHRHMTPVMAAAAFLARLSAETRRHAFPPAAASPESGKASEPGPVATTAA